MLKSIQITTSLMAILLSASCVTSQTKNLIPREAFLSHWKEKGSKVQITQVLAVQNGIYRGNGIVDEHPIEEFYNPSLGTFSQNAPTNGYAGESEEKKILYKDLMNEFAHELSKSIPVQSRIAVLNFLSDDAKETKLSSNIAAKLEMGLTRDGREVVDRGKMDQVLKEHQLQQSQSALFDPSSAAQLGKFVGATVVVTGSYHLSMLRTMPRTLTVSARVISVETTRVLVVQEKEIPLDGNGSDNRDEISELAQSH